MVSILDKEKKMKNKKLLLAILAIALVFGMTACKEDGEGDGSAGGIKNGEKTQIGGGSYNGAPMLNGIWIDTEYGDVLKFNNGNYELGALDDGLYYPGQKGTYTTNNPTSSTITMKMTHWYDYGYHTGKLGWVAETETNTYSFSISGNTLTLDGYTFTKQ
jgi:hypothetical protein